VGEWARVRSAWVKGIESAIVCRLRGKISSGGVLVARQKFRVALVVHCGVTRQAQCKR
jgi:hypothetical protein